MKKLLVVGALLLSGFQSFADTQNVVNGQVYNCPDGYGVRIRIIDGTQTVECVAGSDLQWQQQPEKPGVPTGQRHRPSGVDWQQFEQEMSHRRQEIQDLREQYNCDGNLVLINGQAHCSEGSIEISQ